MSIGTVGVHDILAGLRKWPLERLDDHDPNGRVYRDGKGNIYHSVTRILQATAPDHQKEWLANWLERPGSVAFRDSAATRGTLAHNHAELLLKTTNKIGRATANRKGSWKTGSDGLERLPKSIFSWAYDKAIAGAPTVPWSAAGYARGLAGWIGDNVTQAHAIEFSIHHPTGFAGTADGLLDVISPYDGKSYLTVVDWKTSERQRSEELLGGYIDQLGAYSLGLNHLTELRPRAGCIVVARRSGAPQVRYLSELELRGAEVRFAERVERYFASLTGGS